MQEHKMDGDYLNAAISELALDLDTEDKDTLFRYFFEHKRRVLQYAVRIINLRKTRLKNIFRKIDRDSIDNTISEFKKNVLDHDNGKITNPYEREAYFAITKARIYINMFGDLLNSVNLKTKYSISEIKSFKLYQLKKYNKLLRNVKEIKRAINTLCSIKYNAHERHVSLNEHHIKTEGNKGKILPDHLLAEYVCDTSSISGNSFEAEMWHLSPKSKCTSEFRRLNDGVVVKIFDEVAALECSGTMTENEISMGKNVDDIARFKNFMVTFQKLYSHINDYAIAEKAATYDRYSFDGEEFNGISKLSDSILNENDPKVLLSEICSSIALSSVKDGCDNFREYFMQNIEDKFAFLKPYSKDISAALLFLEKPTEYTIDFCETFDSMAVGIYEGLTGKKIVKVNRKAMPKRSIPLHKAYSSYHAPKESNGSNFSMMKP